MNKTFLSIPKKDAVGPKAGYVNQLHYDERADMTLATDGHILVARSGRHGVDKPSPLLAGVMSTVPPHKSKPQFVVNPALLITAINALRYENGDLPSEIAIDFPANSDNEPMLLRMWMSSDFAAVMGVKNTRDYPVIQRRAAKRKTGNRKLATGNCSPPEAR